jgi:hypothetical protein
MSPDVKDVDEAPIDGTDEARARAAAAREAAKRKHDELVKPEEPKPASKKPKKATPRIKTSTHTVAVPEGYEPDTQRDAAVFGGLAAGWAGQQCNAHSRRRLCRCFGFSAWLA